MSKQLKVQQSFDSSQIENYDQHDSLSPTIQKPNLIQDQSISLGLSSYSHKIIGSQNNYQDQVLRDGEKKRQNIFQQQDMTLNNRNEKIISQTVFDLASDFDINNRSPTAKDQFESNLHRLFDQGQSTGNNLSTKDEKQQKNKNPNNLTVETRQVIDLQPVDRGIYLLGDRNQESSPTKLKKQRQHKHNTQIPSNLSQKEISLQLQTASFQQDSSSGHGNQLNQQIISRISQKHSSYAVSYSSNQNESNQQISNKMNDSSHGSNNFQLNQNNSQKFDLKQIINLNGQIGQSNKNIQKNNQGHEISIMNIIGQDNPSYVESGIPPLNINQPLLNNNPQIKDEAALIELRKKRQSRMSIAQQSTVNKFSFKFFKKANMIKRFIQNLVTNLPSRVFEKLEFRHFNIIGDKVFQFHNIPSDHDKLFRGKDRKLSNTIQNKTFIKLNTVGTNLQRAMSRAQTSVIEQIPIIQPNGILLICWNIFLLSFLLTQLIIVPLLSVFDQSKFTSIFLFVTEPLAVGVFIIQIFLNLNTGYYSEGEIVKSRMQIFKQYLRFYLWLDIFTIAFVLVSEQNEDLQYIKLIYIFRIVQVMQLLNNVEEHFQLQQKYYTAYELTKLFALVFFVAHYSGCIFYLISKLDYQNNAFQESWIKKYNVANENWGVIYLDSIYFSFITMVTVGFGDIVPISSNEKIYVTFFSIVSCGIFGYAVNTIGAIFHELSQKQANYKLKKFEITQYMEGRQIQRTSQIKVLKYLEYMNSQEEERNYLYKGEQILNGISKHLREEVQQDFFGKILLNSVIFKNVFSSKLIEQLSLLMKEVTLGPGDIIFNKGDIDNRLYYVFKGSVENTLELNNKVIKFGNYLQGEFFGQSGFFADIPRTFTAKSKGTTHIVYCRRDDMLRLIEENPTDLEAFSMIKDEILFKESICGHKCVTCLKPGHIEQKCNYINIKINKPLLFVKNNYSIDQQRSQQLDRVQTNKYNAVKKYTVTKKLLKQLRVACVLEAVEQWDDLTILQDTKITDKEFFMRMPMIKYNEVGQIMQETEDSFYSGDEEDIQFFSKEDYKGSQDLLQGLSDVNIPHSNQKIEQKSLRMINRHQTHKISIKQDDFQVDKSVLRSKTKKDTFNFNSPNAITKRYFIESGSKEQIQTNIFPQNQQENPLQRQNSVKTNRTQQRHDSNSSINSYNETFKRNASRNLSHFGTTAQTIATIAQINLNLASTMMAAKVDSDSKIESPRGRSNLSVFNPKVSEQRQDQKRQTQIIETHQQQQQQQQIQQQQQFEEFFQYDIENDFDLMKEYSIYYPQNNLTQVLRQIRKNWLDRFSKKRFKTKGSYKTTQKSKSNVNKIQKSETRNTQKTNQQIIKSETKNTQKTLTKYDQSFYN